MEFYILDENFRPHTLVDEFVSAIWTERYSLAGDATIVVEPSAENVALFSEGTRIQVDGSQEVVTIETALIEDGLLKASGNTLDYFLNNRIVHADAFYPFGSALTNTAQQILQMVYNICILGIGSADGQRFGNQLIPRLVLANNDTFTSHTSRQDYFWKKLYDAIAQLAAAAELGFSLYLGQIAPLGEPVDEYELRFRIYEGVDRTSDQAINEVIQFSPDIDNLAGVTQLRSIAEYKNVAYAYLTAKEEYWDNANAIGVAYADVAAETAVGLDRRVMLVEVTDIEIDEVTGPVAATKTLLEQRARDALVNNNYIRILDGEIILQDGYMFRVNYGLGDIVELVAYGQAQKVRITEFIRSQDREGERAYPTVSVID